MMAIRFRAVVAIIVLFSSTTITTISLRAEESCCSSDRHCCDSSAWFDDWVLGEEWKNVPIDLSDHCVTFSFGGELRYRFMNETDRLRPGGPGHSTYDLWRWRNYLDVHVDDWLRIYVEGIDASIFDEDLPVTPVDLNRWDLQDAFIDLQLGAFSDLPGTLRYGRQDLLYGKQRLVSPLDWANTRRNFEGFKYFHHGDSWNIDIFATNPVNTAAENGPLARFDNGGDRADNSQTFSGIYTNYHGWENHDVDLYWLWLRDTEPVLGQADGRRHTTGARWAYTHPVYNSCCDVDRIWDFEIEGAYQFGSDNGRRVSAGFLTAGLGHTWKSVCWTPKISGLIYWGSGDDDPNDGDDNTFDVLFPLGHAYWGIIDNLSGQNLLDYSLRLDVKPSKKISAWAAFHWFDLATNNDVLYNVAGVPLGTAGTGTNVGQELDLVTTYTFNPSCNVQVGYSWFWYGTFVDNNLPRDTAEQLYVQTTLRY